MTCNTYLQKSGLLGTIFGLLLGMGVILIITWNLQYMIRSSPNAGGIYIFEKRVGGKDFGFLAGWFVLLTYAAILWANITSVPLFARFFLGDAFRFGFHYRIFGYEVWFGEALLSICAILLIAILVTQAPSRVSNRMMILAAAAFVIGFLICTAIAITRHDPSFSYSPLYNEGSNAFAQIVRIAAISPWAFIGFENAAHFSEEYSFSMRKIRRILLASVLITTLMYILVSLLSVSAYPPEYESWMAYIQDMGSLSGIKAVPAFYAADRYLGPAGVAVLMISLFCVILTSLIANLLALSRLLYAAGREGEAPKSFKKLNRHGSPEKAILFVVAVSCLIPFLGRTAIGWIVDVTTLGAVLIYGLISHAVFMHAKAAKQKRETYTGILGLALMGCFLILLLVPGLLPFHAMENESYVLFIVWAVLGLLYFRVLVRRDPTREYRQRVVVWIFLLLLMLFASMMWVSRATEKAADEAAERIFAYHQSHPEHDETYSDEASRAVFLHEQAAHVSQTNAMYTLVSLGLFIISTFILLSNYRDTQKLGDELSAAEEAAEAARRIAALRASVAALMDNMPGMSFSKDAKTGAYLACNQAFAEYAHRKDPEAVLGLTDAEIFDPVTAARFAEDDKLTLSMDEPYIFYEDVPDAAGNQRQLQTTRLKYTDEAGRLCTLGIFQDVTELVRIQRENATTKEAYEQAKNTGLIYTHIAQTLAHGYEQLYYVNLDTDAFIDYLMDEDKGTLTERRRGWHFFDEVKAEATHSVHPDDLETVLRVLDRKTLLDALERNKTVITTYRMLSENGGRYLSMRISRMEDDDRCLVIGVSDVDEQMKHRRAAERAREERIAYARINALTGDFLCVYVVDPETGQYREFSSKEDFKTFSQAKEGRNFFEITREAARQFNYPEDVDRFLAAFTRENVLEEIERSGMFTLTYRLLIDHKPHYAQLRAAIVEEQEGRRLIVGINDIDAHVRREEDYERRLAQAQSRASIDALTGVKNKHAYLSAEEQLNRQIAEQLEPAFAITILDVNDLKKVNDTGGHQAGDQYLRDACKIICMLFKHSPVFRIGGDEFAVISQGEDLAHIEELVGRMGDHNSEALRTGGIVIACGMAKYEDDLHVAPVFERADQRMYENKNNLKND